MEIRVNPWLKSYLQKPAAIHRNDIGRSFVVFDPHFIPCGELTLKQFDSLVYFFFDICAVRTYFQYFFPFADCLAIGALFCIN